MQHVPQAFLLKMALKFGFTRVAIKTPSFEVEEGVNRQSPPSILWFAGGACWNIGKFDLSP